MRAFSSSTESFSDCTCPDTVSILPLAASLCAFSFCCKVFTAAVIWLASSAVCFARCLQHAQSASPASIAAAAPCPATAAPASAVPRSPLRPRAPARQRKQREDPMPPPPACDCESCVLCACLQPSINKRCGSPGGGSGLPRRPKAYCPTTNRGCPRSQFSGRGLHAGCEPPPLCQAQRLPIGRSRTRLCGSTASTPRSTPCRTASPCRS